MGVSLLLKHFKFITYFYIGLYEAWADDIGCYISDTINTQLSKFTIIPKKLDILHLKSHYFYNDHIAFDLLKIYTCIDEIHFYQNDNVTLNVLSHFIHQLNYSIKSCRILSKYDDDVDDEDDIYL